MSVDRRDPRILAGALTTIIVLAFAWIVWTLASPIDLPFQRVTVSMDASAEVTRRTVRIVGTTDLPDGSLIDYAWAVPHSPAFEAVGGQAVVEGATFAFEADIAGWPSGQAEADVSFSCDWGTQQPARTTHMVGDHCEHLDGELVYVDSPGDSKQLYLPVKFTVP